MMRALAPALAVLALSLSREASATDTARSDAPREIEAVVEVRGRRSRQDAAGTTLRASEARRQAGTLGDPLKAVESMPGIARGGANGELIAWGSATSESAVLVDGVPIPFLFHGSGVRGVVAPEQLSSLELVPGAFGAEHGRALGGLVKLTLRAPSKLDVKLDASADFLDAGLRTSAPVGGDTALAFGAREGYVGRWLPRRLEHQDAGHFVVPTYRNWFAQSEVSLDPDSELRITYLAAEDTWARSLSAEKTHAPASEELGRHFQRLYVTYFRDTGAERARVTPFIGVGSRTLRARRGERGYGLVQDERIYGLRASDTLRLDELFEITLGIDALGTRTDVERSGTLTLPAREGDPYAFGVAPARDSAFDAFETHVLNVAPYVEATLRRTALTVTPGFRADTYLIETSAVRPTLGSNPRSGGSRREFAPDLRLSAQLDLDESVALLAAAGRYHQAPEPVDLSAVFGNPRLGLSRAFHATFGEWVRLTSALDLTVLGFYKALNDLPVRSSSTSPKTTEALVQSGEGRVFGTQTELRARGASGWSGWLAWTMSRSERRSRADEAWRRFDYDQTHVVSCVVQKSLGSWIPSLRLRYATGSPRTPIEGSFQNLSSGEHEPMFGDTNSIRLPDFFQLDTRVEWSHVISPGTLTASIEALNVTGRRNAEEFVYGADYRSRDVLTGMPPLLNLGVRYEK